MSSPVSAAAEVAQDKRKLQVYDGQVRLLYCNANAGAGVTVAVSSVLAYLQWGVIPHGIVIGWLLYMLAISLARFVLARRFPATNSNLRSWGAAFTAGAALSAAGWGAAGVLLYPEGQLANQVVLTFVLGGMMLGAGSILAARPEAFFAFLAPAGLPIAVRFLLQGDELHRAMALLAAIFTVATLVTTWHHYQVVRSSLRLRFENEDLVVDLQRANQEAATLNQQLEVRVRDRTAELHAANERLLAEFEQRKRMEEEVLRARKVEALGVLAGGIAHDFNNFLTVVQGNLELAKLDLEPGHPVGETLDEAGKACQRAASLASHLLTFGKGGAPVRRPVSVVRLVRDAVELSRAGGNAGLEIDIAKDLWPAEIDAAQISHALHNILTNARQAMPQGGVIEVRAENIVLDAGSLPLSAGKYVRITVRDYGCGIPLENLSRVFDPYFTTKPSGTGLGLAAAYSIVAKHQGHITVQSTPGVETTFQIYLPATDRAPLPELTPEEVLHTGSGRILVMDDEEALRRLLAQVLTRLGYEVACAADGAEAIVLYEEGRAAGRQFDAVLLDLTVPGGMGGLEAAAKLREMGVAAKLIASSGYSDAAVMSEFRKYGFDDAIPKPWTPAQMSELLQRVMAANRTRT